VNIIFDCLFGPPEIFGGSSVPWEDGSLFSMLYNQPPCEETWHCNGCFLDSGKNQVEQRQTGEEQLRRVYKDPDTRCRNLRHGMSLNSFMPTYDFWCRWLPSGPVIRGGTSKDWRRKLASKLWRRFREPVFRACVRALRLVIQPLRGSGSSIGRRQPRMTWECGPLRAHGRALSRGRIT